MGTIIAHSRVNLIVSRSILLMYAVAWLGWHTLTLDKNPLPWYDDTYFASVSNSLLQNGTLVPTVVYSVNDHQPVYHYGPLYFGMGAISFKLAGFGIFQFRMVNFMWGLLLLFLTYHLVKHLIGKEQIANATVFLFSLDPFFGLCLHEGRMDSMAGALAIGACYFLVKGGNKLFYLSAIMLGLSILTTSRALFFIPPVVLFMWMDKKSIHQIFGWSVVAALPVLSWLGYSFSSWDQLMQYVRHKNAQESMGYFLNTRWPLYVPVHSMVLIGTCLAGTVGLVFAKPETLLSKATILLLSVLVAYYVVVVDYGPYSIMIVPIYYCLLAIACDGLGKWFFRSACGALLLFNVGYFSLKATQIVTSWEKRDAAVLEQFLSKNIPNGSNVVGDAPLYFAVESTGSSFQYIDHFGNDIALRERKLIEDFDFDYLILSDQYKLRSSEDANYLVNSGRYVPIDRLELEQKEFSGFFNPMQLLSDLESSTGYDCTIYKRKR